MTFSDTKSTKIQAMCRGWGGVRIFCLKAELRYYHISLDKPLKYVRSHTHTHINVNI